MNLKNTLGILIAIGVILCALSTIFVKGPAQFIWILVGLALILVAGITLIFSSLYLRAKGNIAYFKTGAGKALVIMDKGQIIIPFLHELIPVSLETMKIVVEAQGREGAIITKDRMRANMSAQFYIRVKPDEEDVKTAARTLGDKIAHAAGDGAKRSSRMEDDLLNAQTTAVTELEKEKLVNALGTIGAKMNLNDINLDREEFKRQVMGCVAEGLRQNGLEIEDVTLSKLDQASKDTMDPDNAFDVVGLKNLQKTIAENSTAENEFRREAELKIKEKDVETRKAVLAQEQDQEFAEADKAREVTAYKAEQAKLASVAEIENAEEVKKREIAKNRAIELEGVIKEQQVKVAGVTKDQTIAAANVEKDKIISTAEVEKKKAVELAEKEQLVAVANKDKERADAEKNRNLAEAEAEAAKQSIETVKDVEIANREKQKAIIKKQAEIEKDKQEKEMQADVNAYQTEKEAEGRKKAALSDFEAKVKAAEAEKISKEKEAAGSMAIAMVPVEVKAKEVEVKAKEVEVNRDDLKNQADFEEIAKDLKIQLAKIEAEQTVRVSMANAMGQALTSAKMTLWGDPNSLYQMCQAFYTGQESAIKMEGFTQNMPGGVKDVVSGLGLNAFQMIANLVDKHTGVKVNADDVAKVIKDLKGTEKEKSDEKKKENTDVKIDTKDTKEKKEEAKK